MRRNLKKWVALLLTVVMLVTMIPMSALAANESDPFYRIFHLDVGRKYFTVDQVKEIIDKLDTNNYTHLELAIGNNGLRFLLENMSVTANGKTYSSEDVANGIKAGNIAYAHAGEWSETEMDTIISYADSKGIKIIPLINTPGHMNTIINTMKSVGISDSAYNGSGSTVDVANAEAVAFTQALVGKYIDYFKTKGCEFFHLGCDEYANDIYDNSAFGILQNNGGYNKYVTYVNQLAQLVKDAGMTPMAFNDGVYFNSVTNQGTFDKDIVITYWTSGWGSYPVASASTLASKGHKIINTNDAWYYVLGRASGTYGLSGAQTGVANTRVTDVPGSNDPAPIGCMMCVWCDQPNNSYSSAEVNNINGLISTLAASNSDYFVADAKEPDEGTDEGSGDNTDSDAELKEETITLSVGGSKTVVVEGADYTDKTDKTELDESYATVNVSYESVPGGSAVQKVTYITEDNSYYIVNSSGQYLALNGSWVDNVAQAVKWTVQSYSGGGAPYQLYCGNSYLLYDNGGLSTTTNYLESSAWKFDNGSFSYFYGTYPLGSPAEVTTTTPVNATKIEFNGVAEGTTYVTVGNTRYTINVVAEQLENVTPLRVELWITNYGVASTDSNISATRFDTGDSERPDGYYVSVAAKDVCSEDGVLLSSLVPATGSYAHSNALVYWKGTCLHGDNNHQTATAGTDKTGAGNDFTYIRYYGGKWAYSEDQINWTPIDNDNDQIVSYYLQKTQLKDETGVEIKGEVDVLVKDWGFSVGKGDGNRQVALSFAFVYPDGTLSASEDDIYRKYTTMFNYWEDRDIGIVAPVSNTDYEISKITVTQGTRKNGTSAIWGVSQNDGVNWEKVTNEAGKEWYNETEYWNDTLGTSPMVNGLTSVPVNGGNAGITWPKADTANLVLIYLKPIHYDSNLIVNWVDDSASGSLISSMEVLVSSDGEEITYYNGLKQNSALPAENVGGSFILDDDAYIVNSSGKEQTFNKDITIIPNVAAQYTSGLYKYVGADLSADGKTLTLHYNIDDSKLALNYVVDFGLSVKVPLSDLVQNPGNVSSVEVTSGSAVVNADKSITYTPSGVLSGPAAVRVKVNYPNESKSFTIGFTPATTVFYEETFATYENGIEKGTALNTTQATSAVASKEHYGYDAVYADDNAQASNGTYVELGEGGKGEFTFTGTGVDIYSNSTPDTGKVMIYLYQGQTLKKLYTVDTKMAAGTTEATNGQAVNAYNVPIVTVKGLTSGTYTVKMEVVKTKVTAEDGTTTKVILPVNIDGFRVHGTLPLDSAVYASDLEENPEYYQLRDMVLHVLGVSDVTNGQYGTLKELATQVYDANTGATGIITDESVTYANSDTVKDLLDNGPKNEIYLYNGQTLTFKVKTDRLMQIGLKALNGNTNYTLTLDETTVTSGDLKTSVDMFYELNNAVNSGKTFTVAVTNNGAGILSVTDLKICDDPNAAFVALSAEDIENILSPEPEYADATLNIALNDVNGNALATTALVGNGVAGEANTFSAATIEEAVAALVPEGYELKDATYADQNVAYGEEATITFTAEEIVEKEPETSLIGAIVSTIKKLLKKFFGWF